MKIKIFLYLFFSFTAIRSNVIIWDIGDTLLVNKRSSSLIQLGLFNTFGYVANFLYNNKLGFKKIKPHLQDLFLDTLDLIPCSLNNPDNGALTISGKRLPALLRENLLGNLSGSEVIDIVSAWTELNMNYFKNSNQRKIFERTLKIYFDPEISSKTLKYSKHIDLLKECYLSKDINGKRKNTCIILSNWPLDKMYNLKLRFKEIFQYSDVQLFSCKEKLLKPSPKLFKECLKFKKSPNEKVIFIDDQEENRATARRFGIIATHPYNAKQVLKLNSII